MFKKVRFFWRLLITFIARRKKIILISFSLGVATFFILPQLFRFFPQRQETKVIGLVGRLTLKEVPNEIQEKMSLGLTQIQDDGSAVPGLAREWAVEDNGKVYTFIIADDIFWHDNTPIYAKDINYNFKDVEIEVINDKTIKFKLKEPFAPFPTVVSRPIFKKGFIGASDYKVKKITKSGDYIETINLISVDKSRPHLKYRFYPTEAAAKTALKLGEVHSLEAIVDPSGFEDWKNITVEPIIKTDRYLAVFFDTSKPPLNEKNFRQALAYAIPKETEKDRVYGPIAPASWAYNSDVKPYDHNLQNAKKLLGNIDLKSKKISIRLATTPSLLLEAEKVAKAWDALGLKTDIEPMTDPLSMNFEALLAIQEVPLDPDQYSLWHSTQEAANITNFKNPRIDQLLEEGRRTQDREKRKKIYYDFQRFLVEEVPVIFLYHPVTYNILRK